MISRIQPKIHPDMVNPPSVTLIGIEEDEVSDPDLGEIFDLNSCIRNYHDARGRVIHFKGAARYRAMGLLRFQTERNHSRTIVAWQAAVTPNHANKS